MPDSISYNIVQAFIIFQYIGIVFNALVLEKVLNMRLTFFTRNNSVTEVIHGTVLFISSLLLSTLLSHKHHSA